MECECCGKVIRNPELTLPWEDGSNPSAYVRCPYCGYENEQDGYGEDDD